jgi:hypothetical protein
VVAMLVGGSGGSSPSHGRLTPTRRWPILAPPNAVKMDCSSQSGYIPLTTTNRGCRGDHVRSQRARLFHVYRLFFFLLLPHPMLRPRSSRFPGPQLGLLTRLRVSRLPAWGLGDFGVEEI